MKSNLSILALVLLLSTGCASLFKSTVTITSVVDAGMKSWAELSVGGFTTPEFDAQVKRTHAKYQLYSGKAADILRKYKAGTATEHQYADALEATRQTALAVLDALYFVLEPTDQAKMKRQIEGATSL
jgi:hypothetical protein